MIRTTLLSAIICTIVSVGGAALFLLLSVINKKHGACALLYLIGAVMSVINGLSFVFVGGMAKTVNVLIAALVFFIGAVLSILSIKRIIPQVINAERFGNRQNFIILNAIMRAYIPMLTALLICAALL